MQSTQTTERDKLIEATKDRPGEVVDILLELKDRVKELEARLKMNSGNSSMPPSTDGLRKPNGDQDDNDAPKPPKPKSERGKSGRNPGGQKGRKGSTLKKVDAPDKTEPLKLAECPKTGVQLSDDDIVGHRTRQVFDIPSPRMMVTEYKAFTYKNPITGELIETPFPDDVKAPTQYGKDLKSLLVYLYDWHFIPNDRLVQLVDDLFGCRISPATINAARKTCYSNLEDFEKRIDGLIKGSSVAHADETGFRVKSKLHWLHVACTQTATKYYVHEKRGADAMDDAEIWLNFNGRLIHDCWKTYFGYDCEHGLCNAHVIRELRYIHENMGQDWAKKMIDLLYEMKGAADKFSKDGVWFTEKDINSYERRFKIFLTKGDNQNPYKPPIIKKKGRPKRTKPQNLILRMRTYGDDFLAFLKDPDIPFTNNLAEQDVRMMKVQQKISGCFRTLFGAQIFARVRSYLSTLRKNGQGILDGIRSAIAGQAFLPKVT